MCADDTICSTICDAATSALATEFSALSGLSFNLLLDEIGEGSSEFGASEATDPFSSAAHRR